MPRWNAQRIPEGGGRRRRLKQRTLDECGRIRGGYIYIYPPFVRSFLFHGSHFVVGFGWLPGGLGARRVWTLVLGGGTDFDDHHHGRYSCLRLTFFLFARVPGVASAAPGPCSAPRRETTRQSVVGSVVAWLGLAPGGMFPPVGFWGAPWASLNGGRPRLLCGSGGSGLRLPSGRVPLTPCRSRARDFDPPPPRASLPTAILCGVRPIAVHFRRLGTGYNAQVA